MASTVLARWLFNDGSGTTITEDGVSGFNLSIDPPTYVSWGSDASGTWSEIQGHDHASFVNNAVAGLFSNEDKFTAIFVCQDLIHASSGARVFQMGDGDGDGMLALTLYTGNRMQSRYYADNTTYRVRWYTDCVLADAAKKVLIVEYDAVDNDSSSSERFRVYENNVRQSFSAYQNNNDSLTLGDMSGQTFTIGNREGGQRDAKGKYFYAEFRSGFLSAAERQTCTDALLLDSDTDWDSGGPPPTSVSFTSEPAATDIGSDRVTANATAESDAP